MLNVFPVEIHGAIPVVNPGLIYGAMLFVTFFWRKILSLYRMILWTLIETLIGMLIWMIIVMLIVTLIGILIIIQISANF